MGRAQEPSGDYGYDEAHQDVPGQAAPPVEGAPATPKPAQDPAGDYGYDEAHDF